jgi:predicted RNase H-like nuclease (RuvC/YqgF family)
MLKSLWELTKQVLGLAQDTQNNKADIKALQRQVEQLTAAMQRQERDLEHLSEKEALERRNLVLSLENAMLRLERRLPAGNQQSGSEIAEISRRLDALERKLWNFAACWETQVEQTGSNSVYNREGARCALFP